MGKKKLVATCTYQNKKAYITLLNEEYAIVSPNKDLSFKRKVDLDELSNIEIEKRDEEGN